LNFLVNGRQSISGHCLSTETSRQTNGTAASPREYLAREAWQIEEIQKALKEADEGDFATQEEVDTITDKWTANAR
jgi:predicted transcriptional regulator